MIEILEPAPFLEARALFERAVRHKPILGRAASLQLAIGASYGLAHGGRLLAVIVFWPLDMVGRGLREEVMIAGLPPADVARFLVPLARAAHLILAARAQSGTVVFQALVRAGHRPGQRMARMSGFSREVAADGPAGYERWERWNDGTVRGSTGYVEAGSGRREGARAAVDCSGAPGADGAGSGI